MRRRIAEWNGEGIKIDERIRSLGSAILHIDGKNYRRTENIVVRSGSHYMAAAVAGLLSLEHGGVPSNLYVGLGDSLATNAGVPGPTPTTPIPVAGSVWNGPSYDDWRRTGPIANLWVGADSVKVVNEYITIFATFDDGLFDYGSGNVNIREIVIGISDTEPSANPLDVPAQKPNTVVSRANFFDKQDIPPLSFVDAPYIKAPGGNLTVQYKYRFG